MQTFYLKLGTMQSKQQNLVKLLLNKKEILFYKHIQFK